MAEHAHTTSQNRPPVTVVTSRRIAVTSALLALSGAAVARTVELVQVAPVVGESASPDTALLYLGRQLEAGQAKIAALEQAGADVTDEQFDAAFEPLAAIVEQIEHMPAHTLEGLLVKARAISWCNSGSEIDPDRFCPYPGAATDGRIAALIVRDLLRRA